MRVKNKPFDVQSVMLQAWLNEEAAKVINALPNPFGSFEKAKYILQTTCLGSCRPYQFITTSHNTEDAIEIMKDAYEKKYGYHKIRSRHYKIIKVVGDGKEIIFETDRNGRP